MSWNCAETGESGGPGHEEMLLDEWKFRHAGRDGDEPSGPPI